ncbi:MAG TPA: ABC transporter permease [Verrucomicrobiae bacterium]|nr:ABC transporter permease [Verrucomicrobiae bacterium]
MALPLRYNVRNVLVRWRSTIATVLGIALVVAVFVLLQSLAIGIEKSSGNTGDPRNVMVVRKGSTAESSSLVTREQLRSIQYFEEIARNEKGETLISADVLTLMSLPRKDGSGEANVMLRGVTARGLELRPQVALVDGRWFSPGKREIVVSKRLAARFANFEIGQTFKTGPARLIVVGWLDGGGSAFDSECWMDADEVRSIFDRDMYSSLLIRPLNEGARDKLIHRIETDKRMQLRAELETEYYKKQTMTATPIKWLGGFLAITMSIGAVFAAMNTMYASVGARTREIGTLRVLGFRRRTVVLSFLIEGALLALFGGVLGCLLALPMNGYSTATMGFETFSEKVFEFTITPELMLRGCLFAVIVGIAGTFFPAVRASRLPVISALKSL